MGRRLSVCVIGMTAFARTAILAQGWLVTVGQQSNFRTIKDQPQDLPTAPWQAELAVERPDSSPSVAGGRS
jgi:hypothetical protein